MSGSSPTQSAPVPTRGRHWVLWDGDCGFCRRAADWVEGHDSEGRFDVLPYQEAGRLDLSPALLEACEWAVHVVRSDGTVLRAGRAILFIYGELGWERTARCLSQPPLIWCVELGYAIVARNRMLFSRVLFRKT